MIIAKDMKIAIAIGGTLIIGGIAASTIIMYKKKKESRKGLKRVKK